MTALGWVLTLAAGALLGWLVCDRAGRIERQWWEPRLPDVVCGCPQCAALRERVRQADLEPRRVVRWWLRARRLVRDALWTR